ncbi:MAG: carbohydrate kinase family protein, partial [Patescibacteria group bacterium]
MKERFDFIGFGDTVTDAFIELTDAEVNCDINKERCVICMRFGDKIPYKDVHVVPAVGNSANAAVAASRLGLKSALISNVGDDYFGTECLAALQNEKVDTRFVKINKGRKTNYHYVLMFGAERTILIKHEAYEYELPDFDDPGWVYLSSLGENSLPFHKKIAEYLRTHPKVKLAFQPGTYQIKSGRDALREIYELSEIFICNKEEAQRILATNEEDMKKLLALMREAGPKIIAITDGVNGSYAFDGSDFWQMPMYPDPKPPISRTGAGDAFSSTFTVAIANGLGNETAHRWGPINYMSVLQQIGAPAGLHS